MKEIVEKEVRGKNNKNKLYRVVNLGKNDTLQQVKGKNTQKWGVVKPPKGKTQLAKLKEVKVNNIPLDPNTLILAAALENIEKDLQEIKELSKKILSFLEKDKEAEIESDLETLQRTLKEYKFNLEDEQYLTNNHKHVMDIKRTANKNMNFYKKQIKDDIDKNKTITTDLSMNSIINEISKKFKYYRLSLYIYSYASLLEISLLGNYQKDYLLNKIDELEELDKAYLDSFNKAQDYIKKMANKSLKGNLLSGLGSAEKAIGNLAERVQIIKDKNIDTWLNQQGDNMKQKGQDIKNNYSQEFEDIKDSHAKPFINKVFEMNNIYNNTKYIYFDEEFIYLDLNN